MYHCWKSHNMLPSQFYNLSYGDKAVLTAFFLKEMEEIQQQNQAINGDNSTYESGFKKTEYISDEELTKMYGEKPS